MLDGRLFSAFVLAGGASSRMGVDKATLLFAGQSFVERALEVYCLLEVEPRIVGTRDDLSSFAPVVADLRSRCGPLSGIEAGLKTCSTAYACFIPVDLPLLPPTLLQQMADRVLLTAASVTVPRFSGHEQPLCIIVHRDLLPAISDALDEGDYKVMRVLTQAALAQKGLQAVDRFDAESIFTTNPEYWELQNPLHLSFFNCNAPADIHFLGQRMKPSRH